MARQQLLFLPLALLAAVCTLMALPLSWIAPSSAAPWVPTQVVPGTPGNGVLWKRGVGGPRRKKMPADDIVIPKKMLGKKGGKGAAPKKR
mmetsp:Transcript_41651/g.67314  ORF Transcript_41651/g.67314 Transcript_41651/m.67314 type:complete len:90 (+) Transcript_41651:99-368(+)|eukprot:CAMPEP_0115073814 /NCGR_PEP_ID=MMETSP0227-20121206/14997_1 /TAXON_ID=89957 /ORGANISM="Polarella glacialis, Strain CCMP 1383" /LENGTH=89 /DNA_ID=CAMNT_0002460719 /DNA_START=89 /DNA_END=358 /DNA_ORIENTATION=+